MDRRHPQLIDAATVLQGEFARLGAGFGDVLHAWRTAVGEDVARHAVPTSLRDGVLRVRCSSSIWTSELQLLSTEVLGRLRERLGERAPERLACYTGRVASPAGPEADTPPREELPPLPPDEKAAIQALVAGLPEDGLRQSVERAIEASRQRAISCQKRR